MEFYSPAHTAAQKSVAERAARAGLVVQNSAVYVKPYELYLHGKSGYGYADVAAWDAAGNLYLWEVKPASSNARKNAETQLGRYRSWATEMGYEREKAELGEWETEFRGGTLLLVATGEVVTYRYVNRTPGPQPHPLPLPRRDTVEDATRLGIVALGVAAGAGILLGGAGGGRPACVR